MWRILSANGIPFNTILTISEFQVEVEMVAVNETSGAVAQAGGSPNSKEASPTKVREQR